MALQFPMVSATPQMPGSKAQNLPLSQVIPALPPQGRGQLSTYVQPATGSQESTVQAMPSSQSMAGPPQLPAVQVSPKVQTLPSSQLVPSGLLGLLHSPVLESQIPTSWH